MTLTSSTEVQPLEIILLREENAELRAEVKRVQRIERQWRTFRAHIGEVTRENTRLHNKLVTRDRQLKRFRDREKAEREQAKISAQNKHGRTR